MPSTTPLAHPGSYDEIFDNLCEIIGVRTRLHKDPQKKSQGVRSGDFVG